MYQVKLLLQKEKKIDRGKLQIQKDVDKKNRKFYPIWIKGGKNYFKKCCNY